MEITRITPDNGEAFEDLIPDHLAKRDDLIWFGTVSDEKEAVSALAIEVMDEKRVDIAWLYTDPSHREEGAATELLDTVSSFLNVMSVDHIGITFADDDEEIEDFLADRGFLIGYDRSTYSVPVNDIIYSPRMDELLEMTGQTSGIVSAEDDLVRQKLKKLLDANGIEGAAAADISAHYTRVAVNMDGEVTGCILIKEREDSNLEISYFLNKDSQSKAIELVADLCRVLRERDIDSSHLIFTDPEEHSIRFVEGLTEEYRNTYMVEGILHGICLLS